MSLKARVVRGLGLWSFAVALLACDSSTDEEPAGKAGSSGSAGQSGAGGGASDAKDQCQNTEDLAWLKGTVSAGKTGRDLAREKAGDCGLGCLSDKAPDKCAIDCMLKEGVKLSNGCAGCYGGIVLCTINNCLPKCINDPQAQGCKDCQAEQGCDDTFYACTGPLD
jgi:hypothetical protein